MKKLQIITLILVFASLNNAFAQCKLDYSNYDLVVDEEFDTYHGDVKNLYKSNTIWKEIPDDPLHGWGVEYFPGGQSILVPDNNGGHRLRLNATRLSSLVVMPNGRVAKYKSGLITLKNESELNGFNIFDPRTTSCLAAKEKNQRGFRYGVFEFRAKMGTGKPDKWDVWPALWILSVCAEFDLVDGIYANESNQIYTGFVDWSKQPWYSLNKDWVPYPAGCAACPDFDGNKSYKVGDIINTKWNGSFIAIHDVPPMGCAVNITSDFRNLQDNFTTYSLAWTPDKLTFFVEGREIFTRYYDITKANLSPDCPLNLIASLQMWSGAKAYQYSMDIDYIKVYKPHANNYSLPYKSTEEFIQHDILRDVAPTTVNVHPDFGSIAANPNDSDEIFYRGEDNYLYIGKKVNDHWQYTRLEYNDGVPVLAKGMIKYLPHHDILLYIGANNRINLFGRSGSAPYGFYHHYLTDNWACHWCNGTDYIKPNGVIEVSDNEEIFYTGFDNKMHRYYTNGSNWVHEILNENHYAKEDFVRGDFCIDNTNNNNTIYYQGEDYRIHVMYKNTDGIYLHGYVSAPGQFVDYHLGSMVWAADINSILYISESKIHKYTWNGSWQHFLLNYNYDSPGLGYPGADYAKSSLKWDAVNKRLLYPGFDGRLQAFEHIDTDGANADHFWIDDNWNTGNFNSFTLADTGNYSASIVTDNHETIYYTLRNHHIGTFKYDNCEYILPFNDMETNPVKNIFKNIPAENDIIPSCTVYPNPVQTVLNIDVDEDIADAGIVIYNMQGAKCMHQPILNNQTQLDVHLLPIGLYIAEIKNGPTVKRIKFNKE